MKHAHGSRRRVRAGSLFALLAKSACVLGGEVDGVFVDCFENGCGNLEYAEPFALIDGNPWPTPWSALGNVALADIQQQAARLMPNATGYSLARMGASVSTENVEVRFTLQFEDIATQGVGFYVRQNGGYLTQTVPHGQGYAAFIEGDFRGQPGIGLWKEQDGVESPLAHAPAPSPQLTTGSDYRARFQGQQTASNQTRLRAKLWLAGDAEPSAWQTSVVDATAELQNVTAGIAVDSWSSLQPPATVSAHTLVDSVELLSLCPAN